MKDAFREALRTDEHLSVFLDPEDRDYIAELLGKIADDQVDNTSSERYSAGYGDGYTHGYDYGYESGSYQD